MKRIQCLPVEKATVAYALATACYLAAFVGKIDAPWIHFGARATVVTVILLLAWCEPRLHPPVACAVAIIRRILPYALLGFWYPETCYYHHFIFPTLDQYFVDADQLLFGCQPSLKFSQWLPDAWFSELMYFGYLSYFIFIAVSACWPQKAIADHAAFLFVGSFYCYYLVFIIFPVIGPQFYFDPALTKVPDGGIFCDIVRFMQAGGEKPTGAFPSSHVGITFTMVLFVYRYCRHLFKYALPLFLILVCSTVYIKAHYVVDVIGGFASVALFYPLVNRIYRKLTQNGKN
jgi:membrane-associated phospholipid phosphatase